MSLVSAEPILQALIEVAINTSIDDCYLKGYKVHINCIQYNFRTVVDIKDVNYDERTSYCFSKFKTEFKKKVPQFYI